MPTNGAVKAFRILALAVVALVAGTTLPAAAPAASAATYQATDCYHSLWSDPDDSGQLDAASYGARYDCSTNTWSFVVSTYESWPQSQLGEFTIFIDTDGSIATGCQGFEWMLGAATSGLLDGLLVRTTASCNPTDMSGTPIAPLTRVDGASISVAVPNATLGSPTTINWFGSIQGTGDAGPDWIPDGDEVHLESGFTGQCELVPLAAGAQPSSFLLADDPAAAAGALRAAGMKSVGTAGDGVVRFAGDAARAAAALARAGLAPDGPITVDRRRNRLDVPNDPGFASQWGLPAVNAPAAWSRSHGSSTVVVADIDSGVDANHPDLAGKLLQGFDATTGTTLAPGNSDSIGHGTATAGVIAAGTGNGIGLAGLGWNTMVLPIKDGDEYPTVSAEIAGIRHAVDRGARVINISAGSPCPDANEAATVADALARGVVVVASAGNDATDGNRIQYPAAYRGVIAVGATGHDGQRAFYSHVDDYVTLVAPGGSADGNPAHDMPLLAPGGGITTMAGTSFSAPMVSAAAALVLAVAPTLNPSGVTEVLTTTATNLGSPGRDPFSGFGLLNVDAALAAAAPLRKASLGTGYWMLSAAGDVYAFGDAAHYGGGSSPGAVDIEPTLTGKGYWILTANGQIISRGDAAPYVSVALAPGERAVSLSANPAGSGLWVFTDKGRAVTRGDAPFKGDMSGVPLDGPVLGSVATPTGQGYWIVASDGGIFSFGDAAFHGSTGGMRLNKPVMSMAPSDDGRGYWLVASDGGIFAFGVPFYGSMGSTPLNKPVSGMVPGPGGYLMVAEDGGIFAFGDVRFHGSLAKTPPASPVVAVALLG
jgi:subtilisin family serine protease